MSVPFFFAWVDATEMEFGVEHHVEDEKVLAFAVNHSEGDFATLEIRIKNPYVPLLGPGRKRWMWLSWNRGPGDVVPLFLGRIVGIPQDLQGEVVSLNFIARPVDYEDQKEALAETLRVAPFWDPVFLGEEERLDPDRVLDARPQIWHIDRVTHNVSVSNITLGEDGDEIFAENEVVYESVRIAPVSSPVKKIIIDAAVRWDQIGCGIMNVSPELRAAIQASQSDFRVDTVLLNNSPHGGSMLLVAPNVFQSSWPKPGTRIGGGWSVSGQTSLQLVGPVRPATGVTFTSNEFAHAISNPTQSEFGRYFPAAVGINKRPFDPNQPNIANEGMVTLIPVTKAIASLHLRWDAARSRTEKMRIEVQIDAQSLVTDTDEAEVLRVSIGEVNVDERVDPGGARPIVDLRREGYFATDRGKQSFEYLLCLARAHALSRGRAVEIAFQTTFDRGVELSLRKNAFFTDPRIPGGQVAGKIISYELICDGGSGELLANVTLGATVGNQGDLEIVDGEPTYVAEGYVDVGYQIYDGAINLVVEDALAYFDYSDTEIETDGVDLFNITKTEHLLGVSVSAGLQQAFNAINDKNSTPDQAINAANSLKVDFEVLLRPVNGGPFVTNYLPQILPLQLPKTIDLGSG
jgi:hypothetical protein